MILQDVDDKYDKKNTLPFLANCKTRSLFWHLKKMADRGYGLHTRRVYWSETYHGVSMELDWASVPTYLLY